MQHLVVTYLIRVVACGDLCKRFTCMVVYIRVVLPSCAFMPSICSLMTYQSIIMASFSVPLLSICRGKLHRQVHVCDLLISSNHSPSTFMAVHLCRIPWPTFRRSWKEILQDRLHLAYIAEQLRILGLETRLHGSERERPWLAIDRRYTYT